MILTLPRVHQEESPLEPDRYGAPHSIRLIGMSSLSPPVYRGPCIRNPIENGDTSSAGNVGEEGAIGTMRNGNWGLKDCAIIWIIQFQRLKMHDRVSFFFSGLSNERCNFCIEDKIFTGC